MFAADRPRHAGNDAAVDGVLPQVDELQSDLLSERCDELRLGEHALVDQDASERLALLLVFPEGSEELVFGDQSVLQQDIAQLLHTNALHAPLPRGDMSRRPRSLALDRRLDGSLEKSG